MSPPVALPGDAHSTVRALFGALMDSVGNAVEIDDFTAMKVLLRDIPAHSDDRPVDWLTENPDSKSPCKSARCETPSTD